MSERVEYHGDREIIIPELVFQDLVSKYGLSTDLAEILIKEYSRKMHWKKSIYLDGFNPNEVKEDPLKYAGIKVRIDTVMFIRFIMSNFPEIDRKEILSEMIKAISSLASGD